MDISLTKGGLRGKTIVIALQVHQNSRVGRWCALTDIIPKRESGGIREILTISQSMSAKGTNFQNRSVQL